MQTRVKNSDAQETVDCGDKTDGSAKAFHRWEVILLVAVVFLALVLRLWGLNQNRWGAEYYTAAVRSMAMNWHNFFYTAFDPTGFISVDKPPVALWFQVASVKIFGFSPLSVLLPQVLMGVGSVWLLFHLVRRRFSASAALLAALFLATTPIWVAVNRTNNTDTCLLLVLLLATWALMKAAEQGSRWLLMLSMVIVGLAFNIKMLAAYIVLPTFCLVYMIGTPRRWTRKFVDLTLGFLVLVVCSLPWVLVYEFTPKDNRPFVGGSHKNSMLELVVGHNAVNHFFSPLKSPTVNKHSTEKRQAVAAGVKPVYGAGSDVTTSLRVLLSRLFVSTPAGPLRLAGGQLGAQTAWLLPFALIAIIIGISQSRFRRPLTARHLAVLFWSCWIVTYGVVYSYLNGIIHYYYLSTLAPAMAALAGIGIINLWIYYRRKNASSFLLPATLLLAAGWQFYIQTSALGLKSGQFTGSPIHWLNWLHFALIGGTLIAVAGLVLIHLERAATRLTTGLAAGLMTIGLLAILILPCAWALSSVLIPGHGLIPSADLYRLIAVTGDNGKSMRYFLKYSGSTSKLVTFLQANRKNERYLLMTSTTELAAPIIINTGEAVLARGGFHGIDPALTPESLARMVKTGAIRFVMLGDVTMISRGMGSDAAQAPVDRWVRANGKVVDPSLWQSLRMTYRGMELYDLRPAEEKGREG
jgi:4-amino-4-deoxy-L-arabinose transferase-like glycosyltransferase